MDLRLRKLERSHRDYTPRHLAPRILQSRAALEGERKQVTVLFADVKGPLERAEQVGDLAPFVLLECSALLTRAEAAARRRGLLERARDAFTRTGANGRAREISLALDA